MKDMIELLKFPNDTVDKFRSRPATAKSYSQGVSQLSHVSDSRLEKKTFNLDAIPENYNKVVNNFARPAGELVEKWLGMVEEVHSSSFTARLINLDSEHSEIVADFGFDEVTKDDKPLVKKGSSFYWIISRIQGYEVTTSQTIRFRRLPKWQAYEVASIKEKAQKFYEAFRKKDPSSQRQ